MNTNQNNQLEKHLNPIQVWSLALGCIIGWGAFVMPGTTFLPKAGPAGTLIAMGIAALIMICIAFNYSYMINHYPVAGGEFVYAQESFGKVAAYICAWFLGLAYLAIVPLNATALALIGRNLLPGLFQWGYLYSMEGYSIFLGEILLSVIALIGFALLSIRGISATGKFQAALAFSLVGSVALLGIAAIFSKQAKFANMMPAFSHADDGNISLGGIVAVIAVAPWAFVGFDSIPQASEEFNFSPKKSRAIMIFSIFFGGLLYVVLNTVTASVVPEGYANWQQYIGDTGKLNGLVAMPTFYAAKALLGTPGLVLLAIALLCAVLSGIIGFYTATSRLLYSVANAGVLPKVFGRLHPKYHTPHVAILFTMVISLVAPWFGREVLGWVVDMSSIGAAIGFGFTSAATFVTIKKNKDAGFGMRLNSVAGMLFSIAFIIMLLSPAEAGFGGLSIPARIALAAWVVIGFILYLFSNGNLKFKRK